MGLRVRIFKNALFDGCANGGLTERVEQLTLTNVDGPFDPIPAAPAAVLDTHVYGCLRIIPEDCRGRWMTDGGAYAATSDSRFREACERLTGAPFYGAVAIHDRGGE